MTTRSVFDASTLPTHAFGHRSILWWGTLGFVAIEGMGFLLAFVAYFYLRGTVASWPPAEQPPDLLWGTLNLVVVLVSVVPNHWTKAVAEKEDLARTRIGLLVMIGFGTVNLALRVWEFGALNTRWDLTAYGSIVWALMGLHTVHLLTDVVDTVVLTALMFVGPDKRSRFVDVAENAFYWDFVVASWVALYVVVYWAPRLL